MLDNVKLVQVIIDWTRQENHKLYIGLLDQEKAYDSVDHDYLLKALSKIGVPRSLIMAIRGFYCDAQSTIMINGTESKPFRMERGVRQGDPLSCLLFNIVIGLRPKSWN